LAQPGTDTEDLGEVVVLNDDVVAGTGCAEITVVALKVGILEDWTDHLRINNQAGLEIDVNALLFLWDNFSRTESSMMSFRVNKKCQLDRPFLKIYVSVVLTIFLDLFESSLAPAEN